MFIKKFFSMQWYAPVWIEIVFVYQVSNKIVPNLAKCLVLVMFLINKQRDPKTAIVTLKRPTGFNQDFVMLADFFHLLRFWSNVWFAKKDTKRSSVLLLCLVSFFAHQTLQNSRTHKDIKITVFTNNAFVKLNGFICSAGKTF